MKLKATVSKNVKIKEPTKVKPAKPSKTKPAGSASSGCSQKKQPDPPELKPLQPALGTLNPDAPKFTPNVLTGKLQKFTNCYMYAIQVYRDHVRIPGRGPLDLNFSKPPTDDVWIDPGEASNTSPQPPLQGIDALHRGAIKDGLQFAGNDRGTVPTPPPGHYVVAVFHRGQGSMFEYDWCRQDADGTWSNKPGNSAPQRLTDAQGKPVTNPNDATFYPENGYSGFGGWYFAPKGGLPAN